MRLRLDALLAERGMSAYRLIQDSGGRLSPSTVYRLARDEWECLPREVLDALCEVLRCTPGELLTREPPPKRHRKHTERG